MARQVSYEKAFRPAWARDGKQIFFAGATSQVIMSASFDPATGIAGEPQKHSEVAFDIEDLEVMPNGDFLVLTISAESWTAPNRVYVNWQQLLR